MNIVEERLYEGSFWFNTQLAEIGMALHRFFGRHLSSFVDRRVKAMEFCQKKLKDGWKFG